MASSSVNAFEDIQAICKDFRRRLKRGDPRRIEECLPHVAAASQEVLFQNLLVIDLEFRRRSGDEPTSEEYIARFPQFARLIRQAFYESTLLSMDAEVETPAAEDTIVLGLPAARRLREYELLRELGRGGFGVVYAAKHLKRGEVVALKTLPMGLAGSSHGADDAERLHKFRQEFRQLSEVNHPNLVGMQSLEVEGNQWFLTMDLIDGVDFLEYVRPNDQVDEERLRSVLKQLVAGIVALHERGIVHRDLKPSNVLVSKDGRVTILDFGLVAELQQPTDHTVSMHSQNFAGTPRYAAPEQAAGTRSAAGDWYALGVMIYEAFTCEAPFRGTGMQMIVKKQTEDSPQLSEHDDVPQDLAVLVDQLLQRESHARPDATTICDIIGVEEETISYGLPDDSESHGSTTHETLLIGREEQLAELEAAKDALLETYRPLVVFVSGLSGEGKTSLVEKFLQPKRRDDKLLVLSGRCYDRESVPFKAVDCIIDALAGYLRSRQAEALVALLPDDIPMLAQLFPVLRRVQAVAERSDVDFSRLDSRQIRYRAFAALRELLCNVSRRTPVVMFIDDLQWGDADSAAAFAELLQSDEPPAVLLLGSYRTDEAKGSPFLAQWGLSTAVGSEDESNNAESHPAVASESPGRRPGPLLQRTIEVGALSEQECLELCAARLGCDVESLRQGAGDILAGIQGNPYFLEQVIEGFDPQTGKIQALSLDDVVERRLGRLHAAAKPLLEAIAVAGEAVSITEAAAIANVSESILSTITHMRSEQLVRFVGSEAQQLVDTYHDKIRETTLARILAERLRSLHLRFAEWLEASENISVEDVLAYLEQDAAVSCAAPHFTDRVFDIAYHFHAANDPRGFAYQLLAGELSYQAYASEDALEFLKRAEECKPPELSNSIQYRMYQRLASSHARLRKLPRALEVYDKALPSAPSPFARAAVYADKAFASATLAKHSKFVENCRLALDELGVRRPSAPVAAVQICLMAFRAICLPHRRWDESNTDEREISRRLQIRVHVAQVFANFEIPGIEMYYAIARLGAISAGATSRADFTAGMSVFAGSFTYVGFPAIGWRQLQRAESITRMVADAEMRGSFLAFAAPVYVGSGNTEKAETHFKEAIRLLEKAGAHWQATYAAHIHRHLLQFIGSSSREVAAGEEVLSIAESIGDIRAQAWGHYDIASGLARGGSVRPAIKRLGRAQELIDIAEEAGTTRSIYLATKAFVLLQASDYTGARQAATIAWEMCKSKLFFMEYNSLSLPLLIQSILGPDWTNAVIKERRPMSRLLWQSRLLLVTHPALHSVIHRSRGRAFRAFGQTRKAIRSFHRAIQAAERFGSDFDRAKSLLDLAAVEAEDRDEQRREAIKLLKEQESVIPYAERWLLGDQYDEQVVAPPPDADMIDRTTEPEHQQ